MLDRADVTLLVMVLIVLAASHFFARLRARRHAALAQKYRLYKVRDDLVYLVASGVVREDDPVFREFYEATNYFINATDSINLRGLLSAIREARKRGIDPAATRKRAEVHDALKHRDGKVAEAVGHFYRAMTEVLLENSWLVRTVARNKLAARIVQGCARATIWFSRRAAQREAYLFYQDYVRAADAV